MAMRLEERERRPRRKKRRFGGGLVILALLVVLAAAAYKMTGGLAELHMPAGVPKDNVKTDFAVDLSALAEKMDGSGDFSPQQSDLAELKNMESRYPRYKDKLEFFIGHAGHYDQTAVNTLLLSPEKIDFVLLSPFTQSTPTGDWDISVREGKIPYFIQYDSRWAFHEYGSSCVGNTGCGPTCLSMAVAGLTGDKRETPDRMCDFAADNGYYVPGSGTSWNLFTGGAASFGVNGATVPVDRDDMENCLENDGVLIASMTPGDFTMAGHFIVIYASGTSGFRIYDPSSMERSGRTWSYAALSPQIAQLWCLTRA